MPQDIIKELVDLKVEEEIDKARYKAFSSNRSEDVLSYYKMASAYFQDRYYRRMNAQ